jgi:hypothetical protein
VDAENCFCYNSDMKKYSFADEPKLLKRVTVRLMLDSEKPRFDLLLETKHYLASAHMAGQTLRYVAELDGEWVAIASFSAAALNLKAREKWIGWSARQKARRLSLVVNNSRFLVLPDRQQLPNLASRALGLCLRRLSRDWLDQWGHPVLIVESFVDETRYKGVCYRACGFEAVGETAGYSRSSRDFYEKHGAPKQLYIRELEKSARSILRQSKLPKALAQHEKNIAGPCSLRALALGDLFERFRQLKRTRRGHGMQHSQAFVLACAAVTVMMGANGYKAMEDTCQKFTQRQLKALGSKRQDDGKYRAPSSSTFFRVLNKLDTKTFDSIIAGWLIEQDISCLERIAVDGKVLCGSKRENSKPLQLLSAVTHRLRITLAQQPIKKK